MDPYNFQSVASDMNGDHSVIEVQLTMRRTPAAIAPVVDQLMWVIRACQCVHRGDRTVEVALHEALRIAVVMCDVRPSDRLEDISVKCRCESEREVMVMIGLARAVAFHGRDWGAEPTIHLIKRCVDEVYFEKDGTALHLRKRRDSARSLFVHQ